MAKIFLYLTTLALIVTVSVQSCEKPTFEGAKIKASKYLSTNDPDDIKLDDPIKCITSTEALKDALQITVKNQNVKILHEGAVQGLQWLHILNLEQNGIEEIKPGAFQDLPTIASIFLGKNHLKTIPEGVFNNMQVKRLRLSDNSISTIETGAFDNMPNLERIDLDRNKLQQWNRQWFTNTPNVYFLSLNFNQITELPRNAFKNFKGKHEVAGKSPLITSIYLSDNQIEEIHPTAFKGINQLEFLDFENNKIKDINANTFANFEQVKYLLLTGNDITCLSDDFLHTLPTSETINVNNNHLDCKCLKKMQNWAKTNKVNLRVTIRAIECMQERMRDLLDSVKSTEDEEKSAESLGKSTEFVGKSIESFEDK